MHNQTTTCADLYGESDHLSPIHVQFSQISLQTIYFPYYYLPSTLSFPTGSLTSLAFNITSSPQTLQNCTLAIPTEEPQGENGAAQIEMCTHPDVTPLWV